MDDSLMSYREMKEKYLRRHPNPHTRRLYIRSLLAFKKHMNKFMPGIDLVQADWRLLRDGCEDWAFTLTAKVKPVTARTMVAVVSGFYEFLIKEAYIEFEKNPAAEIPIWDDEPRKPMSFPDAELADTFEVCLRRGAEGGKMTGRRNWLMFRFLTEGGFRAFELCNIRLEDVEIETGKVFVTRGKRNRSRTTMVLAETGQFLAEFAAEYSLEDEDFIFMHRHMYGWESSRKRLKGNGVKPLSTSSVSKMLHKQAQEYGFTKEEVAQLRGPHGFRHLWACRHIQANTHHVVLMRMAGWRSLSMLMRYIEHATPGLVAIER